MAPPLRVALALALVSAALLAGCSGDPAPADPTEATPALPPAPVTSTVDIPFTLAAGAGTPVVGANAPDPTGSQRGGPFDVPEDATRLVVDAEWTCASGPACEIAVVLFDDDGDNAAVAAGFSPAHLEVEAPAAGGWSVAAFASSSGSVVVDAAGTFRVSVAAVPDAAGADA